MQKNKKIIILASMLMLLVAGNSFASPNATMHKIDELNSEIAVLEKQLEVEELKKKIRETKGPGDSTGIPFTMENNIPPPPPNNSMNGGMSQGVPPEIQESMNNGNMSFENEPNMGNDELGSFEEEPVEEEPVVLPQVLSISGIDKSIKAKVLYDDGSTQKIKIGEELKNFEVLEIDSDGVTVKVFGESETEKLAFHKSLNTEPSFGEMSEEIDMVPEEPLPMDSTTVGQM